MRQTKRFGAALALLALLFTAADVSAVTRFSRQNYTPVGGVATNASWVGAWVLCNTNGAIGWQVVLTGTSAPVATWGVDITNDETPNASGGLGATALTLTTEQTAANPIGDSANINFLFYFAPAPPAKWCRFKYTRSSGGSASLLLKIGVSSSPPGN